MQVVKVGSYWAESQPFDDVIEMIQQPMRPVNITYRPPGQSNTGAESSEESSEESDGMESDGMESDDM